MPPSHHNDTKHILPTKQLNSLTPTTLRPIQVTLNLPESTTDHLLALAREAQTDISNYACSIITKAFLDFVISNDREPNT